MKKINKKNVTVIVWCCAVCRMSAFDGVVGDMCLFSVLGPFG